MDYALLCLFFSIIDLHGIVGLFVTDLSVPEIVDFRDNVTLSCSYNISEHTLNSVKWYKDEMEFFRYSPMMHPMYMKFQVRGVQVTDSLHQCNESTCRIEMSMLGVDSSGRYKCEVSGDAPHFKLAARSDNMTVAAMPQSDPLIESFNSVYMIQTYLSATCISDFSSLPTRLSGFINGEPVSMSEVRPSSDIGIPAHNFTLRRELLHIYVFLTAARFYHAHRLELRCVAEIENFPELRRETTLIAALVESDNLNNQMLIHASNGARRRSAVISALLVIGLLALRCS